jgi:hypothetical protein
MGALPERRAEVVPIRWHQAEELPPPDPETRVPPSGSAPAFDWRWQQSARWLVGVVTVVVFLLAAVDGLRAVLEAFSAVF